MLIEQLKTKFNVNEPIFTNEILDLLNDYSRAYVFRLINQEKKKGNIIYFDEGVYYLPKKPL